MGLAERFKDKLSKKDIFLSSSDNNSRVVSTPIVKTMEIEVPDIEENDVVEVDYNEENSDLENELMSKINKTPYWTEYSLQRQEKMISSYFDKRYSVNKLVGDNLDDIKKKFVQNVITLANRR